MHGKQKTPTYKKALAKTPEFPILNAYTSSFSSLLFSLFYVAFFSMLLAVLFLVCGASPLFAQKRCAGWIHAKQLLNLSMKLGKQRKVYHKILFKVVRKHLTDTYDAQLKKD
jgi:hypothetical protein